MAAAEQSSRITLTPGVSSPATASSGEWSPERVFPALMKAWNEHSPSPTANTGDPPRRYNPLNLVLVGVVIAGIFVGAYHQLDGRIAKLEEQFRVWTILQERQVKP